MLKVEAGLHKTRKGYIAMRLLNEDGKAVAAAIFPLTLLREVDAGLLMVKEKLQADGILKPNEQVITDYAKVVKW